MTIIKTKQPGGLHSFMLRWNELAEKAMALGGIAGVKPHTSEFESYTKAEKRVTWLEEQIKALQAGVKRATGLGAAPVAAKPVKGKKVKKFTAKASKKSGSKRRRRGQR